MRSADKANLLHALIKKAESSVAEEQPIAATVIIDGGSLLQRLPWPKCSLYSALCELYVQYIKRNFSTRRVTVVFDGYASGATTKDEAHHTRGGGALGVDVEVAADMMLRMQKKLFLNNTKNKQKFINLLGSTLERAGIHVMHSEADADYNIALAACRTAQSSPVTVIADDTDILVLLIHHWNQGYSSVSMKTSTKVIDIGEMKNQLGPVICQHILFLHAVTGCDTTSKPFGLSKSSVLTKAETLTIASQVFLEEGQSKDNIDTAGRTALAALYGCADLNSGRVSKYNEKVVSACKYVPLGTGMERQQHGSRRMGLD